MSKLIDLHIHSSYSDGRYSPEEIINTAIKNNVNIISITDHDNIDTYKNINCEYFNNIEIIKGLEISSVYTSKKNKDIPIHILGYDIDTENTKLNCMLESMKKYRNEINQQYIKEVRKLFGFISEDIVEEVDTQKYYRIGWAIVHYLKEHNYTESEISEVKKYCRKNYPKYFDYDVPARDTIEIIKEANGIPILAHPYSYKLSELELKRMLRSLIEYGIEGLEVYHSECSEENMKKLRMLVESYKLLYSCGSDFHFPTEVYNKVIGHGINENLCIQNCSVLEKILVRER